MRVLCSSPNKSEADNKTPENGHFPTLVFHNSIYIFTILAFANLDLRSQPHLIATQNFSFFHLRFPLQALASSAPIVLHLQKNHHLHSLSKWGFTVLKPHERTCLFSRMHPVSPQHSRPSPTSSYPLWVLACSVSLTASRKRVGSRVCSCSSSSPSSLTTA